MGRSWRSVFYGHLDQVRLLLSQGADVNAGGTDGVTPLSTGAGVLIVALVATVIILVNARW